MQFKAAFTETTIDSIFLRSKQANCEEDMDSFLMTRNEADAHDPLFQIPTPRGGGTCSGVGGHRSKRALDI